MCSCTFSNIYEGKISSDTRLLEPLLLLQRAAHAFLPIGKPNDDSVEADVMNYNLPRKL